MPVLKITAGPVTVRVATLETPTAQAVVEALPFTSSANTWGDEVYFETPVGQSQEPEARDVMQSGEIAYWPPGKAIAICFGPTPVSQAGEMRLASASNVWAQALDDLSLLRRVRPGDPVSVELES